MYSGGIKIGHSTKIGYYYEKRTYNFKKLVKFNIAFKLVFIWK